MSLTVLYIGSSLPSLSETFVYRELFALRRFGLRVLPSSLHRPADGWDEPELQALARESIPIYGLGRRRLLRDALAELASRPVAALRTAAVALGDALCSTDVPLRRRPKVVWQMLAALALAHRVRGRRVEHIHAHMAHVPATIAMYTATQLGVTFSFTGHANDLFVQRTLLPEKLRRSKFAACISEWHRRFYRNIVALREDRLPIVRCGVDVREASTDRMENADGRFVVAVGRLVPKKGFDLLIQAVRRLNSEGCRLTCSIIGDGPHRPQLERLAQAGDDGEGCVQLTGAKSNSAVKEMLAKSDLFVLPCRVDSDGDRDGIPVVLMEAMAAGVCVVSGDLPAIRELVREGETGRLAPPGDVPALAAIIRELIENPAERARLGAGGREWVRAEFSLDRNVRRLLEALIAAPAQAARTPVPGNLPA